MISAATIAALEERGLDYILGARERGTAVREIVLKDEKPFTPLLVERGRGDTQLFVKEAVRRGIVCRNEAEAAKDRADRRRSSLEKRLSGQGAGWQRRTAATCTGRAPARRSRSTPASWTASSCCHHLNAVLQGVAHGRSRRAKVQLRTRPIYHSCTPRAMSSARSSSAAEGVGRPLPIPRGQRRMGRSDPRSRPPAGGDRREGRQARHHPHPCRGLGRARLPGHRRRPPGQLARTPRLTLHTPENVGIHPAPLASQPNRTVRPRSTWSITPRSSPATTSGNWILWSRW